MNSQELLIDASIALAAYADLGPGGLASQDAQLKQAGFASAQSTRFADLFTVVVPTYHDLASDLDVTVFNDASGNLTLGIRGTLPGHDLTITDAQIAAYGAGYDQIVALYNWWQKVSAPAGQLVGQFALVEYPNANATQQPANAVKLYQTSMAFGGQSMYLVVAPSIASTGELTAALAADPDHKIDVTGHSLGAHLSWTFSTLFSSSVGQAVGFDTPGFIDSATNRQFFAALGGTVPTPANSAKFTSVVADEAALGSKPFNAISGVHSQPANVLSIAIENQWLSDEPIPEGVINHSMKMLADSLAVFNLLATLDPSLSTSRYKLLLNGAASGTAASYERLVDAAEALFAINRTSLPAGNDQRDALYQALYGVQASSAFQSMAGKVRIDASSKDLGAKARNDFSALASLLTLSPLVLTATDAANQSLLDTVLQGAWGQTYADWLADKNLTQAERDAGKEVFTGHYLADRAELLDTLGVRNQGDIGGVLNGQVSGRLFTDGVLYEDATSSTTIRTGAYTDAQRRRIWFGGVGNETYSGGGLADHLYGGLGNDVLSGLGGADWLEGNAGNDSLDGADGADTLLGGAGFDIYALATGGGNDLLIDADHAGRITLDGQPLSGGECIVPNLWRKDGVTYLYTPGNNGRGTLSLLSRAGTTTVRDYAPGELGITLLGAPAPTPAPAPASNTFVGDRAAVDFNLEAEGVQLGYDAYGNVITNPNQAEPDRADRLYGSGLSGDLLSGGEDLLVGGDGPGALMGEAHSHAANGEQFVEAA